MSYTAWGYYALVAILLLIYYALPKKHRWVALLAGSLVFYALLLERRLQFAILLFSVGACWLAGLWLDRRRGAGNGLRRLVFWAGLLMTALPLLTVKLTSLASELAPRLSLPAWLAPVGLSFYTLQLVAYLTDVRRGKIRAQENPLKFCLFATFFPQLIQGPIPRYDRIERELFGGSDFDLDRIRDGAQLILWGFFLKYMIADKAALFVNPVFNSYRVYPGAYVWAAGFLYSIQLYADFLACTVMAQGAAQLFGVRIDDNFRRPYFAASIKEYWQRWHISLSTWLRDYVYIPLGGNRRGRARKFLNLAVTFAVSGLWHGNSFKYVVWGLLHAVYQITEELSGEHDPARLTASPLAKLARQLRTFVLVALGLIVFRAQSLRAACDMLASMVTVWNPWVWFDDSLLRLGLGGKEFVVLFLSMGVLFLVSFAQERGVRVRAWINARPLALRWGICLAAVWAVWIFGTYGFGFDAKDFIYGGF